MLEGERPARRFDDGAHGVVRHRQHRLGHAEPPAEFRRRGGERGAFGEQLPSRHMERQILVAELEPRLATERFECRHELPSLAAAPPTRFRARFAGQGVDEGVDVWRDVEAQVLEVVAGVHHERGVLGRQRLGEPQRELGAADAAGERHHLHRNRSSSSGRTMDAAGSFCSW